MGNTCEVLQNPPISGIQYNKAEEKVLYIKLFTEYTKLKYNNQIDKIIKTAKFVNEFFKKHNKKISDSEYLCINIKLFNLNLKTKQIIIDWENNIIKELECSNVNELIKINVEELMKQLIKLQDTNSDSLDQLNEKDILINHNHINEQKSKISKITKMVEFKKLLNKENSNNKKSYNSMNDEFFTSSIKLIIENPESNLSQENIEFINKNIHTYLGFYYNFLKEYFDYLNGEEVIFEKEVEILEKIIKFKESNSALKEVSCMKIYNDIKNIFIYKYGKLDNKYYMLSIYTQKQYLKMEILNLDNFIKYNTLQQAIYLIIYIITDKYSKKQKFIKLIMSFTQVLQPLIINLFSPHEIRNI